jgi:hypothetical protein
MKKNSVAEVDRVLLNYFAFAGYYWGGAIVCIASFLFRPAFHSKSSRRKNPWQGQCAQSLITGANKRNDSSCPHCIAKPAKGALRAFHYNPG